MQTQDFLQYQNKIIGALTTGAGFPGIAREAAKILARPVCLTNTAYRVLGVAGSNEIVEGNLLNVIDIDEKASTCRIVCGSTSPATSTGTSAGTSAEICSAMIYRITGQNQKLQGFLFLLDPVAKARETQIEEGERFFTRQEEQSFIQQICLLSALEFTKNSYVLRAQQEYKDAFIYDLLYSNLDSVKDLLSRGEIWGWNLNRPHAVVVFEIEEFQDFTSDQHLLEIVYQLVETSLREFQDSPILMKKKGQIICILPVENVNSRQETRNLFQTWLKKVLHTVTARFDRRRIDVGIGRVYASPIDLFRSFQEAKVALELGRLMKEEAGMTFFSDLGLARILYHHDQQQLREFYEETLGELIKNDQEAESDLLMTLEEYLKHQCDLKATAQSLYMHPNTLRYRLKKIEDILGVQLDDFDTKLNLMTAFKIKYLQKV